MLNSLGKITLLILISGCSSSSSSSSHKDEVEPIHVKINTKLKLKYDDKGDQRDTKSSENLDSLNSRNAIAIYLVITYYKKEKKNSFDEQDIEKWAQKENILVSPFISQYKSILVKKIDNYLQINLNDQENIKEIINVNIDWLPYSYLKLKPKTISSQKIKWVTSLKILSGHWFKLTLSVTYLYLNGKYSVKDLFIYLQ